MNDAALSMYAEPSVPLWRAVRAVEIITRFCLDAMPGKQMVIDAEYNAGEITEEEAHAKKENLQREVDFYGVLDGAL